MRANKKHTLHLVFAKFFFNCSLTEPCMFLELAVFPEIQGWERACLQVYRLSTWTQIKCRIKSFAESLISSQYGESNSKSPAKVETKWKTVIRTDGQLSEKLYEPAGHIVWNPRTWSHIFLWTTKLVGWSSTSCTFRKSSGWAPADPCPKNVRGIDHLDCTKIIPWHKICGEIMKRLKGVRIWGRELDIKDYGIRVEYQSLCWSGWRDIIGDRGLVYGEEEKFEELQW